MVRTPAGGLREPGCAKLPDATADPSPWKGSGADAHRSVARGRRRLAVVEVSFTIHVRSRAAPPPPAA